MDRVLNYGFSEDQLKGVDAVAIAKGLGVKPQKARMPESKSNGIKTPNGFAPEISAAEESEAPLQSFDIKEELGPASVKVNGPHDLQHRTSTTTPSLPSRRDGIQPLAIFGISCLFPGCATNVEKFHTVVSEGRCTWSKIQESMFNVDAFYHPDSERTESVRSRALFNLAWR